MISPEGGRKCSRNKKPSVGVVQQTVEKPVQPFRVTEIQVMTLTTLTDAGIEGANDEGASGAVIDGKIHPI